MKILSRPSLPRIPLSQGSCRLDLISRSEGRDGTRRWEYAENVKARMVRRMLGPDAVSTTSLAGETGISQPVSESLTRTATVGERFVFDAR